MIRLRNLTKSFLTRAGRNYLFRDVNIDIPAGRNLAILGPNGAGKSTFLRILGGIDFPDSGRVECPYEVSWPLGIAGGFVGHLTGRENCSLVCRAHGLHGPEVAERLEYVKALSGIGEYFEEPIRYYSTGMNGRLNFALSMAFDFDYFLIDEVTSVGDMLFRETAKQTLDAKRARSSVIMVSHSMGSLRDFCDIGIVLKDGEMRLYQDLDEAIKAYFPKTERKPVAPTTEFEGKLDTYFEKASAAASDVKTSLRQELKRALDDLEENLAVATEIEEEGLIWHQVGLIYAQLGHWPRALECFRKAVYFEEQRLNFYPPFVGCLMQCGRRSEAREVIERVLGWQPDNPALLSVKTTLCLQEGEMDEALRCAEAAVELEPQNSGRWNQLANVRYQRGEFEKALEAQAYTIELVPGAPGHWDQLSRILAGLEQWDRVALARLHVQELNADKSRDDEAEEKRLQGLITRAEKMVGRIR